MSVRVIDGYIYFDFRFGERRYRPTTKLLPTEENLAFCKQWDAAIKRDILLGTFDPARHFPEYASGNDGEPVAVARTFKHDAEAWLEAHKESWAEWTYRRFKNNLDSRIFSKRWFAETITREIGPKDLSRLREELIKEGRRDGQKLTNRSVNKLL